MTRCLQTTGQGYFEDVDYNKPEPGPYEIEVRAVMTGVCRSDIDMMQGNFGPLPLQRIMAKVLLERPVYFEALQVSMRPSG